MNAEVQVDTNEIISALSQQIAGLSRDVAVLNAVVEAQKKEIARLRQVENVAKPEISEQRVALRITLRYSGYT